MKNNHCRNAMKTHHLPMLVALALVASLNHASAGQIGTTFTYQGQLMATNTSGPLTGSYEFLFRLCNTPDVFGILQELHLPAVSVNYSLFTVPLSFAQPFFNGQELWLEVAVRPAGSTVDYQVLSPRVYLTLSPYAIFAENASTFAGIPPGGFWGTAGNSGTTPGNNFLGTTDLEPLAFRVNNILTLMLDANNNIVGGGNTIGAGATSAFIGGGSGNTVSAQQATIGGGYINVASGQRTTVAGGADNIATNYYDTVCGGADNIAGGSRTFVGGGTGNHALGVFATIGGGENSSVSSDHGTIGGGYQNTNYGSYSTIGGGNYNTCNGGGETVSGGYVNTCSFSWSTIGGGSGNTCSSDYATIPGGYQNVASGLASFAAGATAQAVNDNSFVWGDGNQVTSSISSRSVTMRASGGYRLFTSSGNTGVFLSAGGGSWGNLCDRNAKENFRPVNAEDILQRVTEMPLSIWNYKTQDRSIRHLGPMAQDFHAAFGIGDNDTSITTVDAEGVALAAIQGLDQKLRAQATELAARQAQIDQLQSRLDQLEKLVRHSENDHGH